MTPEEKRELDRQWTQSGYEELGIGFGAPKRTQAEAAVDQVFGSVQYNALYHRIDDDFAAPPAQSTLYIDLDGVLRSRRDYRTPEPPEPAEAPGMPLAGLLWALLIEAGLFLVFAFLLHLWRWI